MLGIGSLVGAAAVTLLVAACASVVPTDSAAPSTTPATVPPASLTPTRSPIAVPSPTFGHSAELTIYARGDYRSREECVVLIINMGGCEPWLVVDPLGLAHARAWIPYDPAIRFDTRTVPWTYATQSELTPGTYGVALAIELGSDVPTCVPGYPTPRAPGSSCRYGEVVCVAQVEVMQQTERVIVDADYGDPCQLTVKPVP